MTNRRAQTGVRADVAENRAATAGNDRVDDAEVIGLHRTRCGGADLHTVLVVDDVEGSAQARREARLSPPFDEATECGADVSPPMLEGGDARRLEMLDGDGPHGF